MNFNKFKGIQKEREITEREKTNLEYLLKTCDKILEDCKDEDFGKSEMTSPDRGKKAFYWSMHWHLSVCDDEFRKVEFNERDIENFIFAKSNHEYEQPQSEILGMYASVLLDILTERNERAGKKTAFYINGHGNTFDYLFSFAKHVDTLIVENFKGHMICDHIGADGKAGIVICKNIEGDFVLANAASKNGESDMVIGKNLRGDYCLGGVGEENSKAGIVIAEDISSEELKEEQNQLNFLGTDGSVYLVSLRNIESKTILFHAGGGRNNPIQKVLCKNTGRTELKEEFDEGQAINELYYSEKPETQKQYEQNIKEHRIDEIMTLVDSINSQNYEEVADKLRKIYDSLRPKIEPYLEDEDDV